MRRRLSFLSRLRDKFLGIGALRDLLWSLHQKVEGLHQQVEGLHQQVEGLEGRIPDVQRVVVGSDRLVRATESLLSAFARTSNAGSLGRNTENLDVLPVVLFLHIPKTGGTSLDTGYLQHIFGPDERLCETDFFHEDKVVRRHLYSEMEYVSKHFNLPYFSVFKLFVEQGLIPANARYYAGHISYGAHLAISSPCIYLTLLREPVARIISQYRMLFSLKAFQGTLKDFIASGRQEVDNYQVRCLSLSGWNSQTVSAEMLDEAKDNLLRDTLFSVTEELGDLFERLHRRFQWATPTTIPHLHKAEHGKRIHCGDSNRWEDVSNLIGQEDLEQLTRLNRFDIELYRFAKEHLRNA
jgi:hypothetical protein